VRGRPRNLVILPMGRARASVWCHEIALQLSSAHDLLAHSRLQWAFELLSLHRQARPSRVRLFGVGARSAATNALDHQADIAKVQEWLGHANIATTRIYDHRRTRPEDRGAARCVGCCICAFRGSPMGDWRASRENRGNAMNVPAWNGSVAPKALTSPNPSSICSE
jgi:hypothetical protein